MAPAAVRRAARSRSASAATITTFFPPFSVWYRILRAAAAAATDAPTAAEPVKLTARTGAAPISAGPTVAPGPGTTLNTLAGRLASTAVSARSEAMDDASSAGFRTTVLPHANAG